MLGRGGAPLTTSPSVDEAPGTCTGSHIMYRELCQGGGGDNFSLLTNGTARLCFLLLFLFFRQSARESVSATRHSVSSSFNLLKEPVESQRQPSCLCMLLEVLELLAQATGGRERENKRRSTGKAMRSKMRGRMDWKERRGWGGGVCVCALYK